MKINENVKIFNHDVIIYKFIFVFLYIYDISTLIYCIKLYSFTNLIK